VIRASPWANSKVIDWVFSDQVRSYQNLTSDIELIVLVSENLTFTYTGGEAGGRAGGGFRPLWYLL
jgi:hypothetical protein